MTRFSALRRPAAIVLAAAVAAGTALAVPQDDAGAALSNGKPHKPVCTNAPERAADCHAEVVTKADGITPDACPQPPAGAYGAADIQAAYALPGGASGAGATVAIVDAYDNPNAAADLAAYRNANGLPVCGSTDGCFRKVNQSGAAAPLPAGNVSWGQEIDLDLEAVSAACPACKIVLVEATSASLDDLAAADDAAAAFHPSAISNSYGGSEFTGDTTYDVHYNHPGIAVTVSSGDNGYRARPQYPASSIDVTAVGGTSLTRTTSGRGWAEQAWKGAGSGCSKFSVKPAWQHDSGCAKRTVADVSAVADPNTGFAVYDSYGSSGGADWYQFGGTSLASPIIASIFAMGGASAPSYPYAHMASLNDVTSGSNGGCGTYVCNATTGYDGPTGLGTPNGLGAFGGPAGTTPTSTTTTTVATTTTTSVATTTTTQASTTTTAPSTTTTTTAPSTTTSTTVAGTPPSAPQNPQKTSTVGGISFCWQAPASSGSGPVLSYRIYRGAFSKETYYDTVSGSTLCYTDSSAVPFTYYYYRITAVNGAGEGPPSPNVGGQRTR